MKLTVSSLSNLAHYHKTLKHLKLKWYPNFTLESLSNLSQIPLLETLALKFIHVITSGMFICQNMSLINIEQIVPFIVGSASLQILEITGCDHIHIDIVSRECKSNRRHLRLVKKNKPIEAFVQQGIKLISIVLTFSGLKFSLDTNILQGFSQFTYKNASLMTDFLSHTFQCYTVDFSQVNFGDTFPILQEGLLAAKSLAEIKVTNSDLGNEGAAVLAKFLRNNTRSNIRNLILHHATTDDEGNPRIFQENSYSRLTSRTNRI
jgi:hypothetical protein